MEIRKKINNALLTHGYFLKIKIVKYQSSIHFLLLSTKIKITY